MSGAWQGLFAQAWPIWISGGWAMGPLAFNGLVIFALGMSVCLRLFLRSGFTSVDRAWRRWRADAHSAGGTFGRIIAEATQCRDLEELGHYFDSIRHEEVMPFERDLRTMKVSISTAPLLGLLGTVTGMLTTFNALATGGGGDQTMGMIAGGISEALITTETGLVLALTGMIFQFSLLRQQARYNKSIEHAETLCMQYLQHQLEAAVPAPAGAGG